MLVQCCSLLKQCHNNVAVLRQKSWLRIVSSNITFRFHDENDYEYEIFSILRSARAWNSVILAGKRDSLRHSTTSFSENVVVSYPSGEGSTSFKKDNNATLSTWSFPGCLFFLGIREKTFSQIWLAVVLVLESKVSTISEPRTALGKIIFAFISLRVGKSSSSPLPH